MSIARTPWLIVALAALIVGAFSPSVALAQTDDTTAQRLAAARVKYERDMESVRRQVNNAIDKKIDDASKAKKADTDKIAQAVEEKKALQRSGAWPEVPNVTRIRNAAAEAATELQSAYSKAKGEYAKAGKLDLADAITKDLEQFKTQSDIVPWSPNLIEKEPLDARTLAPGSAALTVDLGVKGEYRLEIRAKRTGDTGTLTVEIPLVGGKRLAVPAIVGKDGDIRLVLTVREGYFGADLGVARPVDLDKAASGESAQVSMMADGGTVVATSVTAKAVVKGAPETAQEVAKKPLDQRPEAKEFRFADHWAKGSKLDGSRVHGNAKPTSMRGTTVADVGNGKLVLNSPDAGGGGNVRRDWFLDIVGNRISVTDIRVRGGGGASFQEVSGSGTITDDTISFSYRYRIKAGGTNAVGEGTVTVKRE